MEEGLKLLKVEYLSNHWFDHPQILNFSLGEQIKFINAGSEDDLKILKLEYISNHWLDFPQILNLGLGDWTKIKDAWNKDNQKKTTTNGRGPTMEDDLKILKVEYLSNNWSDFEALHEHSIIRTEGIKPE